MKPLGIFISSVQREFAQERIALRDYLRGDPLMRRFFDPFLFEDVPATDRRPDALYLDEVERCDLYVGLFGSDYGTEDDEGISPTEREFDHATELGKQRLIFLKAAGGTSRHPKMQALIGKAQAGLIRKRFSTTAELLSGLYAAAVDYLARTDLIRQGPFDASPCLGAELEDLDDERMTTFIRTARGTRQFPLPENTAAVDLLKHLNLLNEGRPTNAAIRIRRAALAGQPVVFTDRAEVERNSSGTTQETRGTTQECARETRGTTQETRTTRERILALLSTEPEITRRKLAERIGITADGVKYHLTRLRAAGVIQHVGATKAGRWEVLK